MKREINLSPEQVKSILGKAKEASLRDYLLLKTLTIGDFRVGEVVGSVARKYGVLAARDIARHKNISTTNGYVAELPDEEKRQIIQAQSDLISV